jgi:hypothetical protein
MAHWKAGAAADPTCVGLSFVRTRPAEARIGSTSERLNRSPVEEWPQAPDRREWPARRSPHFRDCARVGAFGIARVGDRWPPGPARPRSVPRTAPERAAKAALRCSRAVPEERRTFWSVIRCHLNALHRAPCRGTLRERDSARADCQCRLGRSPTFPPSTLRLTINPPSPLPPRSLHGGTSLDTWGRPSLAGRDRAHSRRRGPCRNCSPR